MTGFHEYAVRDRFLTGHGYPSYTAYLGSTLWTAIRAAVLTASPNCDICRRPAAVVHHAEYTAENLSGATTAGLHLLCHGCHKNIEFTRAGDKLPPHRVRKKFAARKKFFEKEVARGTRKAARKMKARRT